MTQTTAPQDVHSLICHRDVDMALLCLNSLLKHSLEPLRIVLHDDGSLTAADIDKLYAGIPGAKIITRAETDELMRPVLARYPNCTTFRERWPTGLKLIDIPVLASDDIASIDTDILFFRPFTGMFRWPGDSTAALFMQDYQDAYSLKPWQLGTLKLPSRLNAGLMFIRKNAYDLDFIERSLHDLESKSAGGLDWFHEQTCWAIFAHRAGCRFWDPRQVRVMNEYDTLKGSLVAGHFVSPIRHKLGDFFEQSKRINTNDARVTINTIEPHNYNIRNWVRIRINRRLNRILQPQ